MADQLLSQADVDALIQSLSRTEAAKPTPVTVKPSTAPANKNSAPGNQGASSRAGGPAVPSSTTPKTSPAAQTSPKTPAAAQAQKTSSWGNEQKPDNNQAAINILNNKVADLEKQLNQLSDGIRRLDLLEKKIIDLGPQIELNHQDSDVMQKIEVLSGQLRKIAANLKGTPGYGVRDTFKCEKCRDEGHVAVMFRCTGCGHEHWYGWWPNK